MNKKIFENTKFSLAGIQRIYGVFTEDKYGSWENVKLENVNYASIEPNRMFSRYYFPGGLTSTYYRGISTSKRTIPRLKYAKSISFTFCTFRNGENALSWNGWLLYFSLLNGYIEIHNEKYNYGVIVNGEKICSLQENVYYDVIIKQNYISINNVRYPYAQGVAPMYASGNECSAYCRMDMTSAGAGVRSGGRGYLDVTDIKVVW